MQLLGIRIMCGVLFGTLAAFLIGGLLPRSAELDHHSLTPSRAHVDGRFR